MLGVPLDDFISPEDLHTFQKTCGEVACGDRKGGVLGEWRWKQQGGRHVWLRLRATLPTKNFALVIFDDISQLKAMEEELKTLTEKVKRLEEVIENVPVGLVYTVDYEHIFMNRAVEETTGFRREEMRTMEEFVERCFGDKAAELHAACEERRRRGVEDVFRLQHKAKDGRYRWVEYHAVYYGSSTLWLCDDITEKLLMEEKFRVIFNVCLEPMLVYEHETVVDCNEAFAKVIHASSKAEVLSMGLKGLKLCPEYQPNGQKSSDLIQKLEGDPQSWEGLRFEWMHMRLDGTLLPTLVLAKKIRVGERQMWLAVWQDLTEAKKYEEQLRLAKETAEQASQAKSSFLANMSHEIRTPMNGVIGIVELLLNTPLTEEQKSYLEIIRSSGNNLLRIISDVLDLAKMESKSLMVEHVEFNLREQLKDVVDLLTVVAQEKGLTLSSTVLANVPEVIIGDPLRLRQVLLNLVSNAIKFTQIGSIEVRVKLGEVRPSPQHEEEEKTEKKSTSSSMEECEEAVLEFSVSDTGVGIPKKDLDRLFQAFMQADSSTSRKYGGTGLGLTISKSLVKLMGGDMHVESEVCKGSTFTFTIQVRVGNPKVMATETTDPLAWEAVKHVEKLRVLVAEDNKVNQIVVTRMLTNLGVQWELVENGAQAIRACLEKTFDIILMDCHMPEMDGYEATEQIRRLPPLRPDWSQPLVIALTASALRHERQRCEDAGMDAFLTKPVRHQDLKDMFLKELSGAYLIRRMPLSFHRNDPS